MNPSKNVTYCLSSQLDLFQGATRQISQERNALVAHFPLTSLGSDGPLEFNIPASPMYTNLADTRLYLRMRIVAPGGTRLANDVEVAPAHMLFHALFRKVDVYLGGRLITPSTDTYPWKAAIETLLNFGKDAKESQLYSIFYHKDADGIGGVRRRLDLTRGSKVFELYGPLHVDMFFQDKFLLNEVPMRVVLSRSPPNFSLHSNDPQADFRLEILQAIMYVRRVKISPTIEIAHAKALERSNAIYPLHKTQIEVIPLGVGMQVLTKDSPFGGKVPRKLVIGILSAPSFNGGYADSPFRFMHENIQRIDITLDGEPIADTPLSCDFDKDLYLRAYHNLFNCMNKSYADYGSDITFAEFKNMYSLFCFDLTADSCGNSVDHFELDRKGHLRVVMGFPPIQNTIYVIMYGEFENTLEITKEREVILL